MRGFVPLARRIFDHFLWNEAREYSRFEAWIDLIRMAAFRDETVCVQGRCLNLHKGELVASVRYLGTRWGWSKSKAERFIGLLVENRMVETRTGQGTVHLKLCNYERYNLGRDSDDDSDDDSHGTSAGQSRDKVEEPNNGKKEEGEEGPRRFDPANANKPTIEQVIDYGKSILAKQIPEEFCKYWHYLREKKDDWQNNHGVPINWKKIISLDWSRYGQDWASRQSKNHVNGNSSKPPAKLTEDNIRFGLS